MANARNFDVMIFINAKQGKVASAKLTKGNGTDKKVTVKRKLAEYSENAETGAIEMLVSELCEMSQSGNFPKSLLVFAQDQCARRVIEARKHYNEFVTTMQGEELVQAVITATQKDWQSEAHKTAIANIVGIMVQIWNARADVSVVQEHTSHSWELNVPEGVTVENGEILTFKNGVEQAKGITCYDTSYLEGEFKVRVNSYVDQNGVTRTSYFVPRHGNAEALAWVNGVRKNGQLVKKGLRAIVNEMLPAQVTMADAEFVIEAIA